MTKKEFSSKAFRSNLSTFPPSHGKFRFNISDAFSQLERDLIVERTRAGLQSSRRRGIRLGRKPGLGKEAKKKAILAAAYYRDNNLAAEEVKKLVEVRSKRTLYKYLAHEGRRNCKERRIIFWDQEQELDNALCKKYNNNMLLIYNF